MTGLTELIFATDTLFVAVIGRDGLVERANAGLTKFAGRDMAGSDLAELIVPVHHARFRAALDLAASEGTRLGFTTDPTDVPLDVLVRVACDGNKRIVLAEANVEEDGRAAHHLFELADEFTEARRRLSVLAETDPLTGLLNRRGLERALSPLAAEGRPLTAAMLDVDHFKSVNDRYGHPEGDGVLRGISDVLRSTTRRIDAAARYGGEEFAVFLGDTVLTLGVAWAERARAAIQARAMGDRGIMVTVSIGVAERRDGESAESLLARADAALYEAKADGRDRVRVAA